MRTLLRISALVALLPLLAVSALAQSEIRAVTGTVRSRSGAPAQGAIVKLKDTVTLQIRSFVATEGGAFRFSNLLGNRDYEIWAQRGDDRSTTKTVSRFSSKQQVVVDLELPD
jgi:hypothetical protein